MFFWEKVWLIKHVQRAILTFEEMKISPIFIFGQVWKPKITCSEVLQFGAHWIFRGLQLWGEHMRFILDCVIVIPMIIDSLYIFSIKVYIIAITCDAGIHMNRGRLIYLFYQHTRCADIDIMTKINVKTPKHTRSHRVRGSFLRHTELRKKWSLARIRIINTKKNKKRRPFMKRVYAWCVCVCVCVWCGIILTTTYSLVICYCYGFFVCFFFSLLVFFYAWKIDWPMYPSDA